MKKSACILRAGQFAAENYFFKGTPGAVKSPEKEFLTINPSLT